MATKIINTDLQIEARLLDGGGNSGTANQILISTGTGVDWVDGSGSSIIGGPYLPLAGGTMTGTAGVLMPDNFKLNLGTSSDLQIYHDGSDSFIDDTGTGWLRLRGNGGVILSSYSESEIMLQATRNGSVALYYDNSKKFETTSTGVTVTGEGIFTGNVGIGTTSPAKKLHVAGDTQIDAGATGQTLLLGRANGQPSIKANTDNGGHLILDSTTNFMSLNHYVNKNIALVAGGGNVGIGTTSPAVRLDFGNATGKAFHLYTSGADYYGFNMLQYDSGPFSTNIFAGDGGDIKLRTASGTSTQSTRLTVKAGGNVGIGTTSPVAKLHVYNGSAGSYTTNASHDDLIIENSTNAGLQLISPNSSYQYIAFGDPDSVNAGYVRYHHGSNSMVFRTNGGDKMIINSSGNVGIGTTSPSYKLDVNGDGIRNIRSTAGWAGWFENTASSSGLIVTAGVDSGDAPLLIRKQDGTEVFSVRGNGTSYFQNGNVGIGTTSPARSLHVKKSGDNEVARFESDQTTSYVELEDANTTGQILIGTQGDNFKIHTAGTERFRIDGSGNVGIGTTSPSYKLDVNGDGIRNIRSTAGWAGWFENTASSSGLIVTAGVDSGDAPLLIRKQDGTEVFSIRGNGTSYFQNGNVGIGTTSPFKNLNLEWNSSSVNPETGEGLSGGISGKGVLLRNSNTTVGTFANLDFRANNADARIAYTHNATNNGDFHFILDNTTAIPQTRLFIEGQTGNVGIGTTSPAVRLDFGNATGKAFHLYTSGADYYGFNMLQYDSGPFSTNIFAGDGGDIKLRTASGTSTQSTRLTVKAGGNVGIGTTSPVAKLHVYNGSAGSYTTNASHDDLIIENSTNAGLQLISPNSSYQYIAFGDPDSVNAGYVRYHHGSNSMVFRTNGGDKMIINSSGNVGIGTTSPSSPLTFGKSVYGNFDSENFYRIKLQDQGGAHNDVGIGQTASGSMGFNITSGNAFIFNNGTSGEIARFNGTGLGIGTTSPGAKLDVASGDIRLATNATYFRVRDTASAQPRVLGMNASNATYVGPIDSYAGGGIVYGASSNVAYHDFYGGGSTKVRITSAGNVGIGTTSPGRKLHVDNSSGVGEAVISGTTGATLYFRPNALYSVAGNFGIFATGLTSGTYESTMDFKGYYNGVTTPLTIKGSGNVGIGTTSPQQKLQVASPSFTSVVLGASYLSTNNNNFFEVGINANDGYLNLRNSGVSTTVHIDSDGDSYFNGGNVGIGTTSPQEELHIASTVPVIRIEDTDGGYAQVVGSNGSLSLRSDQANTVASSRIDFTIDNSEKMRIDSSGNVGIGTSPSYKLDVSGTGRFSSNGQVLTISGTDHAYHGWQIGGSRKAYAGFPSANSTNFTVMNEHTGSFIIGTNSSEKIRINSSGNVGIGTTSPDVKLEVVDASPTDGIVADFVNSTNAGGTTAAIKLSNADSEACDVVLGANRVGANFGSDFFISLSDSVDGSNQERFRITEAGNVGIGTTSPSEKLDVAGTVRATSYIAETGVPIKLLVDSGTLNDSTEFRTGGGQFKMYSGRTGGSHQAFVFATGDNYTSGAERMRITSAGNVGIGTTSPGYKLDVNGTLHSSNITLADGIYHESDTNTYINFLSDQIQMATAGSVRVYINSSGNVGIGTTSPSTRLHVAGIAQVSESGNNAFYGGNYVRVFGDQNYAFRNTGGTNIANISMSGNSYFNGGNVGIGTTSPASQLGSTKVLDISSTGNGEIILDHTDAGVSSDIGLYSWNRNNDHLAHIKASCDGATDSAFISFHAQPTGGSFTNAASNEKMRIKSNGNVGIGTTSPTSRFHVKQTLASTTVPMAYFEADTGPSTYGAVNVRVDNLDYGSGMRFYRPTSNLGNTAISFYSGSSAVGSITVAASSTSYNTTSDYRLKENVVSITDGIDRIKQLQPKRFNFIGDTSVVDGFIAHEAKQVVPEAVTGEKDEVLPNGDPVYQGIDQAKIVPLLTAALQEAVAKIEDLENRIQTLENK